MDREDRLKQEITQVVTRFESDQMSVRPEPVSVTLQPRALLVTLRGTTCLAEKNYARGERGRELLGRLYAEVFDTAKPILEAAIEGILGQKVDRSMLSVDAESGDGVILFALGAKTHSERTVGNS
jgi:uncharacterized protein YbcI